MGLSHYDAPQAQNAGKVLQLWLACAKMQAVIAIFETQIASARDQDMNQGECFLLFGGAGLTGKQIARRISTYLHPRKIVIASLFEYEVNDALEDLRQEYSDKAIEWEGEV